MKRAGAKFSILLLTLVLLGYVSRAVAKSAMTIRVVRPISSTKILPTGTVTAGEVSGELSVSACRGEYEPASFVITAPFRINSLQVEAGDLEGPGGTIPAKAIDIKVVKCWYQSGTKGEAAEKEYSKRALIPGLLLNDERLIKVDYQKKENYLQVPVPTKQKYIWISNPDEKQGDNPGIPSKEFPLRDSPVLLPVDIPANRNQQFWVTVHVPEGAEPGTYSGRITLSTARARMDLRFKVRVLPFELSKPYYTSSMYYRNPGGPAVLLRYRKEMENLIAHGVTNPIYYPAGPKWDDKFLQIRQELGMAEQPLYTIQNACDPSPAEIKEYIRWARSYGFTGVYFCGIDEAHTEKLVWQIPRWQRTKKAGGRVFASGAQEAGSKETYGHADSYFRTVGHVLDVFNNGRRPTREQAALWHSRGHKIWSYANPHVGQDDPEIYRRNYGLVLWKNNYDGIGIYAYRHSPGNPYNDFDGGMRDLNLTYPTINGAIDTVVWEGYREGIDDVRYVTTLTKAIEMAKKSRSKTAIEAEKYLEQVDVYTADLDEIRSQMIQYLVKLNAAGP